MLTIKAKNSTDIIKKRFKRVIDGDYSVFMRQAGEIIAQDLVEHIEAKKSISGGALKENTEETKTRKLKLGKGTSPLIWERVLATRYAFDLKVSKGNVEISRNKSVSRAGKTVNYEDIGVYLQNKGYDFWGISKEAIQKIMKEMPKFLRRLITG